MIFDQNTQEEYTGELLGKRVLSNGYIYTFEFVDPIRQLLDARTVSIDMFNVFEGLIVPSEAIQYESGDTYLNLLNDNEIVRVPVAIATIKDDFAIIKEIKGFKELKEGDKIKY